MLISCSRRCPTRPPTSSSGTRRCYHRSRGGGEDGRFRCLAGLDGCGCFWRAVPAVPPGGSVAPGTTRHAAAYVPNSGDVRPAVPEPPGCEWVGARTMARGCGQPAGVCPPVQSVRATACPPRQRRFCIIGILLPLPISLPRLCRGSAVDVGSRVSASPAPPPQTRPDPAPQRGASRDGPGVSAWGKVVPCGVPAPVRGGSSRRVRPGGSGCGAGCLRQPRLPAPQSIAASEGSVTPACRDGARGALGRGDRPSV